MNMNLKLLEMYYEVNILKVPFMFALPVGHLELKKMEGNAKIVQVYCPDENVHQQVHKH